jgi:hypothetical protein
LFEVNGKNCDYCALLITLAGCSDSESASDEDWDGFSPRKAVVAGDRGSALGQSSQMTGSQNVAVDAEDSDASRGHSILSLYRSVRALLRIDVYRYLLAGMSVIFAFRHVLTAVFSNGRSLFYCHGRPILGHLVHDGCVGYIADAGSRVVCFGCGHGSHGRSVFWWLVYRRSGRL